MKVTKNLFRHKIRFEICFTVFLCISFIIFFLLGPIFNIITIYPGDTAYTQNRLFLLSAIAQSLATVLALVVTITLISVQLASQTYWPRFMFLKLRDIFFWSLIWLYLFTILWAFWAMGWLGWLGLNPKPERWTMDMGLLLTATSLLFLVPYIYEAINSLKSEVFARKLLKYQEFHAVEEVLHRAVSEGFLTVVDEIAGLVDGFTMKELRESKYEKEERIEIAKQTGRCYRNVAKRAFLHDERDAFYHIFRHLKVLTCFCSEYRLREAADIFNDILKELYDFAQEEEEK